MFKAMLIDEDNQEQCKNLLNTLTLPTHYTLRRTWIVWTEVDGVVEAKALPYCVFKEKYTTIAWTENFYIVESIR
jgi:hypothetical protein